MKKPNINTTLANDLCVGCGFCKVSCPHNAIAMAFDQNKEYRPAINPETCIDCGICYQVCPMAEPNLNRRIAQASQKIFDYGIDKSLAFLKGYQTDFEKYTQSSSGGILSALLVFLLKEKSIDAVIHAQALAGNSEKPYFKASLSKTPEEIEQKRSSFYYPIEFSEIIEQVLQNSEIQNVALLGTPCVLSAAANLNKTNKAFAKKLKYAFALICSHNTSAQFTECLISNFTKENKEKFFKHRDKTEIKKAAEFNNSLTFADGKTLRRSRNKTPFTLNWRTFSYAFNACLFCPDFWGADADAGFKDAWGFPLDRKQGETVFFLNRPELVQAIEEMKEQKIVEIQQVEKQKLIKSQKDTLIHKTTYIAAKQRKHKALRKNATKPVFGNYSLLEKLLLASDFRIKRRHLRLSKFLHRHFRKNIPRFLLKLPAFLLRKYSVYLSILSLLHENNAKFEVLYTAGFGYRNIGDEAQLQTNLQIWKQLAPKAKVTLLSPNEDYTRRVHGNYDVLPASRNSFWSFRGIEYAGIGAKPLFKFYFRIKFLGLRINAFFVKNFNTSFFISPENAYLLKRLKNANLLHIGGGGYLTGKTESRLFDYMGLIHLANYMKTDVILSGHNIGVWQSRSQRKMAKKLKKAEFIGLRDNQNSVKDLKAIGVFDEKKVFPLFDDALFCQGLSSEKTHEELEKQGISREKRYIAINSHYWKIEKSKVNKALQQLAIHLDKLALEENFEILLVSMAPGDDEALNVLQRAMNQKATLLNHRDNIQLVVGAFHHAFLCVTMKHHPIIFSMAGAVPAISLAFEAYYNHKNTGALKLFGQEDFALQAENLFTDVFMKKMAVLIEKRNEFSTQILKKRKEYEKYKGFIIKSYLEKMK